MIDREKKNLGKRLKRDQERKIEREIIVEFRGENNKTIVVGETGRRKRKKGVACVSRLFFTVLVFDPPSKRKIERKKSKN